MGSADQGKCGGQNTYHVQEKPVMRMQSWSENRKGKPLERTKLRREGNIKMYLTKILMNDVDWTDLSQVKSPLDGSCEHLNELSGSLKGRNIS
jgi:hypothetical protein